MTAVPHLTADRLRELLSYDPDTGVLYWRVSPNNRIAVGQVAGSMDSRGYWRVRVDGRDYRGHRLIWLHIHGRWPAAQIDHVNGDCADNRLANLREATVSQNQANARRRDDSTSGLKGASWCRLERKWRARIRVNGKRMSLGCFDTPEAAHAAYVAAAREHFGDFTRAA